MGDRAFPGKHAVSDKTFGSGDARERAASASRGSAVGLLCARSPSHESRSYGRAPIRMIEAIADLRLKFL